MHDGRGKVAPARTRALSRPIVRGGSLSAQQSPRDKGSKPVTPKDNASITEPATCSEINKPPDATTRLPTPENLLEAVRPITALPEVSSPIVDSDRISSWDITSDSSVN